MVITGDINFFDVINANILSDEGYFSCCLRGITSKEYSTSLCKSVSKVEFVLGLDYQNKMDALLLGESVKLFGHFLSWRYWLPYEKDIRQQFTFKQDVIEHASIILNTLLSRTKYYYRRDTVVGMHVSRGDHVSATSFTYREKTRLLGFILKAMNLSKRIYNDRVYFIICSEIMKWTKENVNQRENIIFVDGNTPEVDLAILTVTRHKIITAGAYSWWVGFLTRGVTIYSKTLFVANTPYSMRFRDINATDFFPPYWIGI